MVDSLLPTGSGGDLQVEVNEADGQINRFMVPFSAVPNMLKEGLFKYELNAGEVRLTDTAYHPDFAQLNLQYGINNTLTGYGGVIAAENYQAFLLGSGFNLPIGALSVDITHSDARFGQDMPRYQGESYKVAYSRFIHQTNTNFSLAAYRYSTSGYFSLTDAVQYQELLNRQDITGDLSRSHRVTASAVPLISISTSGSVRITARFISPVHCVITGAVRATPVNISWVMPITGRILIIPSAQAGPVTAKTVTIPPAVIIMKRHGLT